MNLKLCYSQVFIFFCIHFLDVGFSLKQIPFGTFLTDSILGISHLSHGLLASRKETRNFLKLASTQHTSLPAVESLLQAFEVGILVIFFVLF